MANTNRYQKVTLAALIAVVLILAVSPGLVADEDPERQTVVVESKFVRRAFTEEGIVVVGYKTANFSVDEEWVLLEIAMTTRGDHKATITRDDVSLTDPSGKTVPLASPEAVKQAGGKIRKLDDRANIQRDTLPYLPIEARIATRIGFYSDPTSQFRVQLRDKIDLVSSQGAYGRFYFRMPEGVQYGDHILSVKFENGAVLVPFRIMTRDDEKELEKLLKKAKKEAKAAKKAGKQEESEEQ